MAQNSEDANNNNNQTLNYVKSFMTILGLWPVDYKGVKKAFYNYYFGITFSYFALFMVAQIIEMAISFRTSIETFAAATGITFTCLTISWKILIIKSDRTVNAIRRIEIKEQEIFSLYGEKVLDIYIRNAKLSKKLETAYFNLFAVASILFCLQPFIKNKIVFQDTASGNYDLIVESWFPFDRNANYWTAYCIQLVGSLLIASYLLSSQMFYFSIFRFIVTNFEILNYLLKNFSKESQIFTKKQMQRSLEVNYELFLKKIIQEHQFAIQFVEDLNTSIRYLIMLEFCISSFQLAAIIYQLMHVSGLEQFIVVLVFLVTSGQLFILYWNGNEIAFQSEQMAMSVLESEWNTYPIKIVKMMQLVILRAQKPVLLDIGPIGKVRYNALFQIYKTIYSYLCLFADTE